VTTEELIQAEVRRARKRDRLVLTSWGLSILVMAGLFSMWIWTNQRQQDRDMCSLLTVFMAGPEPVAGPEGDRAREIRAAIQGYHDRRCPSP
jgi:cytoskeletal protein RodZ